MGTVYVSVAVAMAGTIGLGLAVGLLAATLSGRRRTRPPERSSWTRGQSSAHPDVLKGRYRDLYP